MGKRVSLITGAGGQIGTELISVLAEQMGASNVIVSDLKEMKTDSPFEILDVTDTQRIAEIINKYGVTEIYHLAALLSSKGEQNIDLTWGINFTAYQNLLALCVEKKVDKVFFPSSIGVFGSTTPKQHTPQNTSLIPTTTYGISKLTGELWGNYYWNRYGLDVRSIRFPGVISYEVIPKGGTTDFAVEMFFAAKHQGQYDCYLTRDTTLPMMYMPDVLNSISSLMNADRDKLTTAMGYNISSFSLSPSKLFVEIKKHLPQFTIAYKPDARQKIADSWTETIDDSQAVNDWSWHPKYDMCRMTIDMLNNI